MKKDAKNPSKLKTGLEGALGHNNTVRQNSVFLAWLRATAAEEFVADIFNLNPVAAYVDR